MCMSVMVTVEKRVFKNVFYRVFSYTNGRPSMMLRTHQTRNMTVIAIMIKIKIRRQNNKPIRSLADDLQILRSGTQGTIAKRLFLRGTRRTNERYKNYVVITVKLIILLLTIIIRYWYHARAKRIERYVLVCGTRYRRNSFDINYARLPRNNKLEFTLRLVGTAGIPSLAVACVVYPAGNDSPLHTNIYVNRTPSTLYYYYYYYARPRCNIYMYNISLVRQPLSRPRDSFHSIKHAAALLAAPRRPLFHR